MQKAHLIPACLALAVGLATTPVMAQETGSVDDNRTETIGPTGMPGSTGDGGSADPTGVDLTPSHVTGIPAEQFVEEASAKAYALVDLSEVALEQGSSEIKGQAQGVIEQQRAINDQLRALAELEDLQVADNASLIDRGRAMVVGWRDGDSFDEAYAEHLLNLSRELTQLFESAAASRHGELSEYAQQTLPQLQEQQDKASALVAREAE